MNHKYLAYYYKILLAIFMSRKQANFNAYK